MIAFLLSSLGVVLLFFKKIFGFLRRNRHIIIVVLAILTIASTIIGVIMAKKGSRFNKKIIVLGFDGLSPEIIEPMMREGKLPNFSQLKKQGSYRHLSTTNLPNHLLHGLVFLLEKIPGKMVSMIS